MKTLVNKIKPIALELQKHNIYLSGSLALWLQGIDLERPAHDIDFICEDTDNSSKILTILKEAGIQEDDCNLEYTSRYSNATYLTGWVFEETICELRQASKIQLIEVEGLYVQDFKQILDEKLKYAMSSSSTKEKHSQDLELLGFKVQEWLAAKEALEEAERKFQVVKYEWTRLSNTYAQQQYNFKVTLISKGQLRPYSDSVSHYEIETNLPKEEVEAVARLKIEEFTHITNRGGNFGGACNFPFGLNPYYALIKQSSNRYSLHICHPYTG
jgi:hypothetical protein